MNLSREQAAQHMGMMVSEIIDVEDVDDGSAVVTTHDRQRSRVDANGVITPLGPLPVLAEQSARHAGPAAGVLVANDEVTGYPVVGELVGHSLDEIGDLVAERFSLDAAVVRAFLHDEFGADDPIGDPIDPAAAEQPAPVDEHQAPADQLPPALGGDQLPPAAAPVDEHQAPAADELVDEHQAAAAEPDEFAEVPTGNASDVLEWVGDDAERAALALRAEDTKATKRSSLVVKLQRVVDAG